MAEQHTPVEINDEDLKRAQQIWGGFTTMGKYATIAACLSVGLLALGYYIFFRA